MEDHENDRDDIFFENRSQLTVAERDCLHHLESEEDRIERLQIQREAVLEKLWFTFQSAAASLAQLYKGHFTMSFYMIQSNKARSENHVLRIIFLN